VSPGNRLALRGWRVALAVAVLASSLTTLTVAPVDAAPLTLSFRQTPLEEVFEMLSREARVNILLGQGVNGAVSLNLYNVELDDAIRSIAEAGGFVAENRGGTWMVLTRDEAGRDSANGNTVVRSFRVQYTDTDVVATVLTEHLSRYGKVTSIPERGLVVIEDLPDFLVRLEAILGEIDAAPRQILIEAKILEIALDNSQTFGIDWAAPLSLSGSSGTVDFGQAGLAPLGAAGLFFNIVTPDFEAALRALNTAGRVRTLSTPRLLVMEDQEAEVIIGDRLGYRVTTTINQVTSESVEFLESGVILKVKAQVDRNGKVLLSIHPEVSTGSINAGIPSLSTTEVTTQLLAEDGQKIFIGGLIRNASSDSRSGVPVLSDLPIIGGLFARTDNLSQNSETIVLITPRLVEGGLPVDVQQSVARIVETETALELRAERTLKTLEPAGLSWFSAPPTPRENRPSR